MAIYYSIYASMFFFLATTKYLIKEPQKRNHVISIWGGICVFLLLALRHWSMGIDLGYSSKYDVGYIQSFEKLNQYSWYQILNMKSFLNYEKGYIILNKIIGTIYSEPQFFIAICALINIIPVTIYIYKKSEIPLLSWIIFMALPVFFIYFSGLRQGIAISITILATHYIEKQKKLVFVLTVLFASLFHYSAMIFLIAYPIYYIKLKSIHKILFLVAIIIIFLFRELLFELFSPLLKENAIIESTGAGLLFMFFCLIYLALVMLYDNSDTHQNGMINLFFLVCICQAFSGIYNTAMRVGYYFMIYLTIAIPNTVKEFKKIEKYTKKIYYISYVLIVVVFIILGIMQLSRDSFAGTNPYVFFWEKL